MKKFFTILCSAIILFAGCAQVEDMSSRFVNNREISFVTGASATRAIVDATAMVDNFGVYGWVVPGDYSQNGGYLMKNAEYDKDGNAVVGPYFWPTSDNNTGIDFIFTAYSQYDGAVLWENDSLKITVPTLNQALIDNPDDFDDVLWAQTTVNHHQNLVAEHERVALNFRHALSWIQFRGEVTNANVKWVKIKSVRFGEYTPGTPAIPGTPEIPYQPAVYDTTDTWINLKKSSNAVATSTALKGPGESTYTNAAPIPAALVAEIKSYYSIDNGAAGDYDLKLGNSVWPGSVTYKQLRVVKDIPAEYKMTVDMHGEGIYMDFFDAVKYLNDNGYYIQPGTNGGKPAVFNDNYVILDAYVNGAAYTVTALNWAETNSVPNYTIEEVSPEVPYQPGAPDIPEVPAMASEGVYVDGLLVLPTRDTLTATPLATYEGDKDITLNYIAATVDTIFTNDHVILGNALVIPQPVPSRITIVFDICIGNEGGDDVIFTERRITRKINTGKDMVNTDYVASWLAANKYIYNFNFDGETLDFSTTVVGWETSGNEYYVWKY